MHKAIGLGKRASQWAAIVAGAGAGAALGWTAYSRLFINHRATLASAMDAERCGFSASSTRLSYYADAGRAGRPLVLLHSINAAASAFEMRPLFEHYRRQRPVYALDLPGFGFSERANRGYSPGVYTTAILDFLASEIREPADVVALSLTGEFAARAAVAQPELIRSLTLISPTGFSRRPLHRVAGDAFLNAASVPLWSQAFYDLLVTETSIRYFLRKSFAGPIDEGLAHYDYATAHQPGARFAPLYFVSGKLFTPDAVEAVYDPVLVPTTVLYDRDGYTDLDRLPEFVRNHPNWRAERIAGTMGLPHFEKPEETIAVLDRCWGERAAA
jgi:pimeloyl-ACP methyl ester carboxylesterase